MIPRKLELTNFLSYRETATLQFDGVHLACISGANGAGKSSILDGMTWALFGKSRSRSDDDVVNRLAARKDELAEVRFEFELEGTCYRVIRRKRARKALELEFQIEKAPGQWETLTEGKLRDTQTAIEDLLRMNYDTFTNASFFLQGKADEFTMKTAGKRKEILADLLGVNRWDQLREVAAARRRTEENRRDLIDGRIVEIQNELDEEDKRREALAAAHEELEQIDAKLAVQETLLNTLRRVAEAIEQQKKQVTQVKQMLLRKQTNLTGLRQTRTKRESERAQYQELVDTADAIEQAHAAFVAADERAQAWQEKADAFTGLQQRRRPHELRLEGARNQLLQQKSDLEARRKRIGEMETERESLQPHLAALNTTLDKAQETFVELAAREAAFHEARAALQKVESEREMHRRELAQLERRAATIAKDEEERRDVEKSLEQAKQALAEVNVRVQALGPQRERHAIALAEIDSLKLEQKRLQEEMNRLKSRLENLRGETGGTCPLCGQELQEAHRHGVVADIEEQGIEKGQRYRTNKQRLGELEQEVAELVQVLKQSHRLEQEVQTQQQRQATSTAWLEQNDKQKAEWEAEGRGRLEALQAQLADQAALNEARAAVQNLQPAVQERVKLEQERKQQEQEAANVRARLEQIQSEAAKWHEQGAAQLAAVSERLEKNEIAPEDQQALAALDEEAAALGYDETAHHAARAERQKWIEAPARYQKLEQARAALRPLADGLADLNRQISSEEKEVAELEQQQHEAEAQLAKLREDGGDLAATESEVFALREQRVAAIRRVGAAQQRLDVLKTQRELLKAREQERAEVTLLIQRLERLEKACGRDGVQALLIEQALPEIEADANELLERLSEGNMRITFETQRQLKSREGLAETLDIRISDAAGERPYENYSGGEQFRVNFAVRLALSKILARRAGARLQTLVVDEGFGSQDPAGRQRLVEALNIIQNDFARVLVITHIDELRDAFPARIEVEKTLSGSQIRLVN